MSSFELYSEMDRPSLFLKLWSSCSLTNLFPQSVLALNIQLNIRSSLALVMVVINSDYLESNVLAFAPPIFKNIVPNSLSSLFL